MAAKINWHRYGTKLRHCHHNRIVPTDCRKEPSAGCASGCRVTWNSGWNTLSMNCWKLCISPPTRYSSLHAHTHTHAQQGCSPKKEVGGRLKQDLEKIFKQFRPTYTYTHTRQKNCHSGSLVVLRYSYSCLSVCSRSMQQWTNFCMNCSPKKWGGGPRPTTSLQSTAVTDGQVSWTALRTEWTSVHDQIK